MDTARHLIASSIAFAVSTAQAESIRFDNDPIGAAPAGWTCGVTGTGDPRWRVQPDPGAPSPPNVLKQDAQGTFPWCVYDGASLADGFVEVQFKALSGKQDQAGGVVWRWKDSANYYVARANALENNVSLYYTERGMRRTIKYVDAPVGLNIWHLLRVSFSGSRIEVSLNGRVYVELEDRHVKGPGKVGVWTKADSVTAFDDFRFGQE